jgi:hypothetical protein
MDSKCPTKLEIRLGMAIKLVRWNCAMALHKTHQGLLTLGADD